MNAFECYSDYVALKRHFHSKTYDYFRYNGKIKVSLASFEKRKDKAFFHKLAKFRDPLWFLVYNLALNDQWIGEIVLNEKSKKIYLKHKTIRDGLTYYLSTELERYESVLEAIETDGRKHPKIIRDYLRDDISFESLCLVTKANKTDNYWKEKLPEDHILLELLNRIHKYFGFIPEFDRSKLKDGANTLLQGLSEQTIKNEKS